MSQNEISDIIYMIKTISDFGEMCDIFMLIILLNRVLAYVCDNFRVMGNGEFFILPLRTNTGAFENTKNISFSLSDILHRYSVKKLEITSA